MLFFFDQGIVFRVDHRDLGDLGGACEVDICLHDAPKELRGDVTSFSTLLHPLQFSSSLRLISVAFIRGSERSLQLDESQRGEVDPRGRRRGEKEGRRLKEVAETDGDLSFPRVLLRKRRVRDNVPGLRERAISALRRLPPSSLSLLLSSSSPLFERRKKRGEERQAKSAGVL